MKQKKNRQLFFKLMLLAIIIAVLEVIGYAGMWVNSRSFDFLSNKNYFQIRAMLIADKDPSHLPRYLSQPYLGYIPYPGYKKKGIAQHNEDGYRGTRVPLQKDDKLRVLCLGGSTTYGYSVDSPSQTYPSHLQDLLTKYFDKDSVWGKKYHGAEVINAGLEAGCSAEELQQYLFKYRYYKPDVVIIHSGVNDAMMVARSAQNLQLDYTDSKRLYFNLEPLSYPARLFFKSYLFSFISIKLFYENFAYNGVNGRECFSRPESQLFCAWSNVNMDSVASKKQYDFYPFFRNSKSLYESVIRDSALLLVFPNALNRNSEPVKSASNYAKWNALNVSLSQYLCKQCGGTYAPFDFDSIQDPSCWVDDCHLNAKGEENKAEILSRVIIANLALLNRPHQ